MYLYSGLVVDVVYVIQCLHAWNCLWHVVQSITGCLPFYFALPPHYITIYHHFTDKEVHTLRPFKSETKAYRHVIDSFY